MVRPLSQRVSDQARPTDIGRGVGRCIKFTTAGGDRKFICQMVGRFTEQRILVGIVVSGLRTGDEELVLRIGASQTRPIAFIAMR